MVVSWRFQKHEYKEMTATLGAPLPRKPSRVCKVEPGHRVRLTFSCQNIPKNVSASLVVLMVKKGEETGLGKTETISKDVNPVFATSVELANEAEVAMLFYLMDGAKKIGVVQYSLFDILCSANLWKYSFNDPKTGHRLPTAQLSVRWEEVNPQGEQKDGGDVNRMVEIFRSCCELKDHNYRLRTYPSSFVGRDTVSALVKAGVCNSRDDAVRYGNKLITRGDIFVHVTKDNRLFRDDSDLYRFFIEETK